MQDKAEIRAMMRCREREFLQSGASAGEDAEILDKIESSETFRKARTVLAYMPMTGEVQLSAHYALWLEQGKRIALPLVVGDLLELREYAPDKLREGYKGILEPSEDARPISPSEIDLALVPGMAFTREGARMGRGKGFYDRLLPSLHCPLVGLCYSFRIIEKMPLEPWDIVLDAVVSGIWI